MTFNTDNPSSKRLAFVGQDLVQSGRVAGKLLGDTLGGKGKVIITTLDAAAQWSIDREKGAREALGQRLPDQCPCTPQLSSFQEISKTRAHQLVCAT